LIGVRVTITAYAPCALAFGLGAFSE
jgi:hypothetical protein